MPDLSTSIGPLHLRNPVLTASGTCGYGEELAEVFDLAKLGGLVTKTVTTKPREGNPPPRVCETTAGMLNSIGLQNVGIDAFIAEKVPFIRQFDVPLIANIAGDSVEDFADLASKLDDVEGIAAIELNLSCPNVAGGLDFSTKPEMTRSTCAAVKAATRLPVIAKLSPNVTDIVEIARAAEEGGADAISLINTLVGMSIEIANRKSKIKNGFGGLSGPALKPIAVRMVYAVARVVRIPIIGIGGIMNADDAIEFLMAGASAVQVGTATFANPRAAIEVIDGIADWMRRRQVSVLTDLIGSALPAIVADG